MDSKIAGKNRFGQERAPTHFAYGGRRDDTRFRFETTTADDGTYKLQVPRDQKFGVSRWFVVATKKDYGPGWVEASPSDLSSDLVLTLARGGATIEGRIVDLEGRPVAGMEVRVSSLQSFPDDNPRPYLESLKQGKPNSFSTWALPLGAPGAADLSETARTDDRGDFRLAGMGQNRLAALDLVGEGVEHASIMVVTHPLDDALQTPDQPPFSKHVYGPRFTHVARPSRPTTARRRRCFWLAAT